MKADEAEKLHREVEEHITLREGRKSFPKTENPDVPKIPDQDGGPAEEVSCLNQENRIEVDPEENGDPKPDAPVPAEDEATIKICDNSGPKSGGSSGVDVEKNELNASKHCLGKKCLATFRLFVKTFGLIFLAEWGDRSQVATIVLASVNDVAGIILGSVAGHTVCTSLAVLAGALVAKKIGVRMITIIGGFVFIGFAIASLVMGPD